MDIIKYREQIKGLSPAEQAARLNELLAAEPRQPPSDTDMVVSELMPGGSDDTPADYLPFNEPPEDGDSREVIVKASSDSEKYDLAQNQIVYYKNQLAKRDDLIAIYEAELDKQADTIIEDLNTTYIDFSMASQLSIQYNKQWFKQAVMSSDAKVRVAAALVSVTAKFKAAQSRLWIKLAEMDSDAISEVATV